MTLHYVTVVFLYESYSRVPGWNSRQAVCSTIFDHLYPKFLSCKDKAWYKANTGFYFHTAYWNAERLGPVSKNLKSYLDSRTKGWTFKNAQLYWRCLIIRFEAGTSWCWELLKVWHQQWAFSTEISACN